MSAVGVKIISDPAKSQWYKHKSDLIPDECFASHGCGISSPIARALKQDLLYCHTMA